MGETYELPPIDEYASKIQDLSAKIHDAKEILNKTKVEIKNYYIMVNRIANSE